MKKLFAACAIVMSLAAPTAFAQASATVPDPVTLKAASDMLESMNFRATMDAVFAQMRQSMPAMMKQAAIGVINGDDRLSPAQKAEALARLDGELAKQGASFNGLFDDPALMNEIARNTVLIYARHYSADEMRQIATFYKSPVGAKMLATMPQMMAESMQMTQSLVMPRIDAMIKKVAAEQARK